jgi:hypothetical protein
MLAAEFKEADLSPGDVREREVAGGCAYTRVRDACTEAVDVVGRLGIGVPPLRADVSVGAGMEGTARSRSGGELEVNEAHASARGPHVRELEVTVHEPVVVQLGTSVRELTRQDSSAC